MEPYYVWKHLGRAVDELLTRDTPLLDRLAVAFRESSLLFSEEVEDSSIEPRAVPHVQRLRAAWYTETDPEGPETGRIRHRLEQMQPEEHRTLALAFLRAFVFQEQLAKPEKT